MRRNDQTTTRLARKRLDCALDLDSGMDVDGSHLNRESRRNRLSCAQERNGGCMVRPEDNGYPAHVGRRLLEHSYPFATHLRLKVREPGNVPARACKAGDKCTTDRIGDLREHDCDHVGQAMKLSQRGIAIYHDHIWRRTDQLCCKGFPAVGIAGGPTILDLNVAAVVPSQSAQRIEKRGDASLPFSIGLRVGRQQHPNAPHLFWPLCACRERPHCRAAEKRDELAALHSITSSASVSRLSEILRPSVFAVFKLITSSNLVG